MSRRSLRRSLAAVLHGGVRRRASSAVRRAARPARALAAERPGHAAAGRWRRPDHRPPGAAAGVGLVHVIRPPDPAPVTPRS